MGKFDYKLQLSVKVKGTHDVFHVSMFKPYNPGGASVSALDPAVGGEDKELEGKGIIGYRTCYGNLPFQAR